MTTVLLEAAAEASVETQVADAASMSEGAEARSAAGKETPVARSKPAAVLTGVPCIGCGQTVSWWRYDGMYRLRDGVTYGTAHKCPAR